MANYDETNITEESKGFGKEDVVGMGVATVVVAAGVGLAKGLGGAGKKLYGRFKAMKEDAELTNEIRKRKNEEMKAEKEALKAEKEKEASKK